MTEKQRLNNDGVQRIPECTGLAELTSTERMGVKIRELRRLKSTENRITCF